MAVLKHKTDKCFRKRNNGEESTHETLWWHGWETKCGQSTKYKNISTNVRRIVVALYYGVITPHINNFLPSRPFWFCIQSPQLLDKTHEAKKVTDFYFYILYQPLHKFPPPATAGVTQKEEKENL
tara:strand:- start:80 stop:454 length:375 start_codon:yes stop_codon:yes gene_type:complete